jgi:hypothetical protein
MLFSLFEHLRIRPLLVPTAAISEGPESPGCIAQQAAREVTARQLRQMQTSEFSAWLRTQTDKHKRPFQDETIRGYAETRGQGPRARTGRRRNRRQRP